MSGGSAVPAGDGRAVALDRFAESIAANDLNNLYLTSCFFADAEKYAAFCALYALMRVIDDRIDALPQDGAAGSVDAAREHAVLDAWQAGLMAALADGAPPARLAELCEMPQAERLLAAVAAAMQRFPFPLSLWENFFAAMHRDIGQERFDSYRGFLAYAEGASVAPTSIYLDLVASRERAAAGVYTLPARFDLIAAGRQLGIFCYLTHILRDMARDLATGSSGLLYVARDDLESFGLDERMLREDLERSRAGEPVRALAAELATRARRARDRGRQCLLPLDGELSPDCAFILELIVEIYDQALNKIEAAAYDPFAGNHYLSLEEKQRIAERVAARVGFALPEVGLPGPPG